MNPLATSKFVFWICLKTKTRKFNNRNKFFWVKILLRDVQPFKQIEIIKTKRENKKKNRKISGNISVDTLFALWREEKRKNKKKKTKQNDNENNHGPEL